MMPELGQLALILALCLGLALATFPLLGAYFERADWMRLARSAATGQLLFLALAFVILEVAFVTDDFSVLFVASHSSLALPTPYKLVAIWGGHEGSMLFWLLVLALWTCAVALTSREQPAAFASRVLGVLGIVSTGFLSFTLFTSNPFERLIPAPLDGIDLNPLLQDPGMLVHPPLLYPGFVGMAVPFAYAVAGLMTGHLDRDWALSVRRWTLMAWTFLTIGIALGSAWAYYEIGWGGWWFWDSVENASFMPWLIATALLHSLAVTERRGLFKSWSVLLAIFAFSLVLLGSFLTRSGVTISVHSFAADPKRGLFILVLLLLLTGGALTLYALQAHRLVGKGGFKLVSRESFLLGNNILLATATASILLGTLYPMFLDSLDLGDVSVGRPYFDLVFPLAMLPLAWLIGIGMHAVWRQASWTMLRRRLRPPAAAAAVVGVVGLAIAFDGASLMAFVGVVTGLWVVASGVVEPALRAWRRQVGLTRAQWGMVVAHVGVGVFIVGATVATAFSVERDFAVKTGERFEAAGFAFAFRGVHRERGPNYAADVGEFELRRDGRLLTLLRPERRVYDRQSSPMTEAAIDAGMRRDVFLALGDPLGNDSWAVRVRYKPLIRLIWLGALLMASGGLLAAADARYGRAKSAARSRREPGPDDVGAQSEPVGTSLSSSSNQFRT